MYLCAVVKLSELKLCNEFEVTLKLAVISCVILNLKDAVIKTFGPDVVPKDCFVSSENRYSIIM